MQTNGDLVLYMVNLDNTHSQLWSPCCGGFQYLAIQSNGGLVTYDNNNNTQWGSGTESMGTTPYTLTVYDYYIELTDKNGLKIWNSNAGILYKNVYVSAPSILKSPSYMYANTQQAIISASKNTILIMQYDGALDLYQINADNTTTRLWSPCCGGFQYLAIQSNGGLVTYDNNNNTQWGSGTESMGTTPYTLTVYDYYIELTDKNGLKIWNSNAGILYKNVYVSAPSILKSPSYMYANTQQAIISASKNTILIVQYDGALDLYQINADNTTTRLWSPCCGGSQYLAIQSNGGLVTYDNNNNTQWRSGTESMGTTPYTLTVYDYYIELTDKNGLKIWNSNAGILYKNVYASAPSILKSPSYMYANTQQAIISASKNTILIMQYDGALDLYQNQCRQHNHTFVEPLLWRFSILGNSKQWRVGHV